MIPKIIHYSWFSGDPYPKSIQLFMETWKRVLKDYEFVLWDADRVKEINNQYVHEALQMRKWAFASDVVRLYAVHKYGGIWIDTDVEMFQPFDRFLKYRMFIGREGYTTYQMDGDGRHVFNLGAHCFGAEAGHPFLARCLQHYQGRHFILSQDESLPESLRYDMKTLPEIQCVLAYREFGYDGSIWKEEVAEDIVEGIHIEPYWVFERPRYKPMSRVVCVHHVFGAWSPQNVSRDYDQEGLYVPQTKGFFYYGFSILNHFLRKRGYSLRILSIGRPN